MIFKPELIEKILAGEKTVTRRPVKLEDDGYGGAIFLPCRYVPGRTYAFQPGRGQKGVGRIRVLCVGRIPLIRIDANDARREGFRTAGEFRRYWTALYGSFDPTQPVDRIEFELVEGEQGADR